MIKSIKNNQQDIAFNAMSIITLLSVVIGVIFESYLPLVLPVGIIGLYIIIVDVKFVYFLLLGALCISTEVELQGLLNTDLPGEPLMLIITFCYILFLLINPQKIWIPLKNPVTLLLILHVLWIFMTAITADRHLVSFKFFLAKIWYVIPFYFTPFLFLKERKDIQKGLAYIFAFTALGASFVMIKHASYGFTFDTIEIAVQPIFRNHVNYACLLVIVLPYLWVATKWHNMSKFFKNFIWFANILIPIAIYFSFTRAAIGSVLIGMVSFLIIRFKLTKLALILSSIGVIIGIFLLIQNNRFMEFAPDYKQTISHQDFDSVLEATTKGQDLSTMERVYRWVAGFKMVKERPIVGFGPNNFYPTYKEYSLTRFETYVSDNPQKSGIHNYYLMLAVEQGIPGLIIFLAFCFVTLLYGERYYHRIKDPFYKGIVAAAFSSFIIILSILIVNDLLEADKVGPFFFIAAAFLTLSKYWSRKSSEPIALDNL